MGSARLKLSKYFFSLVLIPGVMPVVFAATPIDPAIEESLRQQQRQIQLEQQRLEREQREREQRRDLPPLNIGTPPDKAANQGDALAVASLPAGQYHPDSGSDAEERAVLESQKDDALEDHQ